MKTLTKWGIMGAALILLMTYAAADISISACGSLTTAGGYYRLTTDITDSAGSCMLVHADYVTLDCEGHTIDGGAAGTTYGVYNAHATKEFTLKNCIITDYASNIDMTYTGAGSTTATDWLIYNNTIARYRSRGITISGSTGFNYGAWIIDNIINGTGVSAIIPALDTSYRNASATKDIIISGNMFINANYISLKGFLSTYTPVYVFNNIFINSTFRTGYVSWNSSLFTDFTGWSTADVLTKYGYASRLGYGGNAWASDANGGDLSGYCENCADANSDGICDDVLYIEDTDIPANVFAYDYRPLVCRNISDGSGSGTCIADAALCPAYSAICLTFRDNASGALITDQQVKLTMYSGATGEYVFYSDETGKIHKASGGTSNEFALSITHPNYRQYVPSYRYDDSPGATPIIQTIYLIPIYDTSQMTTFPLEFRDKDDLTRNLSAEISLSVQYDLTRCLTYFAATPSCCFPSAQNMHASYSLDNNNAVSITTPKGCSTLDLNSIGAHDFNFYDPGTATQSGLIELCSCAHQAAYTTEYVTEDDPYVTISGNVYGCTTWACARAGSWVPVVNAGVTASGDSGYYSSVMTNATGGFTFTDVKKNSYYLISWAKTNYETANRRDYISSANVQYPRLYLNPIVTMDKVNFSIYGYVKTVIENGTLEAVKDVDIYGVYSSAESGVLQDYYLSGYTNGVGYYNFTFATNRYPQPITFNFNIGAYDNVYDSPTRTIIISNTSSGRSIRADITLTSLSFLWTLKFPIQPAGCNPLTDPNCLVPEATITCFTFNGTDCSNRSWAMQEGDGGIATISGLSCGDYVFKLTSPYIQARQFSYNIPCSPGVYYISNGTIILPAIISPSLKKVSYISFRIRDNETGDASKLYVAGARVTLCSVNAVNNTCITKTTDSMGYVQFLRDEGTYAATVTAAGYRPCVMESYGAVCRTGAIYITTPPNAFLEWILDPTSESTDIWEWLTSMNMVGVLQIFILLAVCLALIKIAREFGG